MTALPPNRLVSEGSSCVSSTRACYSMLWGALSWDIPPLLKRCVSHHHETQVAGACLKIKVWTSVQCLFRLGQPACKSVLEGITEHSPQHAGKSPLLVTGTVQTHYVVFMGFSVEGWIRMCLPGCLWLWGSMAFLGVIPTSAICPPFSILPSSKQPGLVIAYMLQRPTCKERARKS